MKKATLILFVSSLCVGLTLGVSPAEASSTEPPSSEGCIEDDLYVYPPDGCFTAWPDGTPTGSELSDDSICCDSPNDARGYSQITSCVDKTGSRCPRSHRFELDLCTLPGASAGPIPVPDDGCPAGTQEYWSATLQQWFCGNVVLGPGDGDGDGDGGGSCPGD